MSSLTLTSRSFLTAIFLAALAIQLPSATQAADSSANNGNGKSNANSADDKWSAIVAAQAPSAKVKVAPANSKSDLNQQKTQVSQQADHSRQLAADAKAFYTQFPNNPNAEAAKKLEVISELHGVKENDATHLKKATDLAKEFRKDTSHSINARTEVAIAADRLDLSQKVKAKTVADRPVQKEKVADAIRSEMGQTPELHAYYLEIAREADMYTAKRIATNLVQWSSDKKVREEAQAIVDRSALVGQKLNLKLTSPDVGVVDLAQPTGAVTVLCTWSPTDSRNMLDTLTKFQNLVPPGTQFVYLALGGTQAQATTLAAKAPLRGVLCYQGGKTVSPILSTLKLKSAPYLYVLNRDGKVVGFGPVSELLGLLSLAR